MTISILNLCDQVGEVCKLIGVNPNEVQCIKLWFNIENRVECFDLYMKVIDILGINIPETISLDVTIEEYSVITAIVEFYPIKKDESKC